MNIVVLDGYTENPSLRYIGLLATGYHVVDTAAGEKGYGNPPLSCMMSQ